MRSGPAHEDEEPPAPEALELLARTLSSLITRPRKPAPETDGPSPMLTVAETAKLLRISRMTVIRKADAGELPCVVMNRGKQKKMRRFPRKFIEDLALGNTPELYAPRRAAAHRAEP